MTSGTIISYGTVVHIGMAIPAFQVTFGKYKRCMAFPAVNRLMLTREFKICFVVVKLHFC
jgi:hypothetical protein